MELVVKLLLAFVVFHILSVVLPAQTALPTPAAQATPTTAKLCLAKKCYGCREVNGSAYCGCIGKNGNKYYHSQTFVASDGCNTCWCSNTTIGCTKKLCPGCTYNGVKHRNNSVFNSTDGCNTCHCHNGAVSCTERACADCLYNGQKHKHNTNFTATDGCNHCWCTFGAVKCTKKACSTGTPPLTCKTVKCLQGQVCVLQTVQCFTTPCYPVPRCVKAPNTTALPSGSTMNPCGKRYCPKGIPCTLINQAGHCGCRSFDGQIYKHGSTLPSQSICDSCYCLDGALACTVSSDCQPSSVCHLPDGSSRSVGMTWSPNNCTRCRCTFSVYGPRVYCIKPSCDYCPGGYYVVGQCCPVCPTKQPPTVSGTSAPSNSSLCGWLRFFVQGIGYGLTGGDMSPTSKTIPGDLGDGVPRRGRRQSLSPPPIVDPTHIASNDSGFASFVATSTDFVSVLRKLQTTFPSLPFVDRVESNFTQSPLRHNTSVVMYSPICTADGGFQTEQCVMLKSGLRCFCVNPITGVPYAVRRYQSGMKGVLEPCPTPLLPTACELQRLKTLSGVFRLIISALHQSHDGGSPVRGGRAVDGDDAVATPFVSTTFPGTTTSSVPVPGPLRVCNNDGSFPSMQCDSFNVTCWCVNPQTGTELPNSRRQHPQQPTCMTPVCTPCNLPCPHGQRSVGTNCTRCACVKPRPICLPVNCRQRCPLGQVAKGDNCTGCQCVQDMSRPNCAPVLCALYCPLGFQRDKRNCSICQCMEAPTPRPCATATCLKGCSNGFVMNGDRCSTCTCRTSSSPCEFTSIMTCFRRIVQQGLTLNLTCTAASTSISCFKRLVTAGKITGCSMSEKEIIGKKLAESKRQQMHTCQRSQCHYGGNSYRNNENFPSIDGCNTCFCLAGVSSCTEIGCLDTKVCVYNGTRHNDQARFRALDGCNDCTCGGGTIACGRLRCDQTRYLRTELRFNEDYNTVIANQQRRTEFMNQFRSVIAARLQVSEAQVTILDVKSGSIIVVFAVQAADLDTLQQQLDDGISSQSFQFTFNGRSLIPDNTQVTYQKQVGSLDEVNDDDDGGSNTALIAGIVCGVAAAVVLIVLIILMVVRYKKTESKDRETVAYSKATVSNIYSKTDDSAHDQIKLTS